MGERNIAFGVAVTLAVSVGFVVPGTPASANAPSGTPVAAASTTTATGIDCLTGVWDYTSFVGPIGAIDLAFTGVSAEFGPGYFSVSGADGTATGTITGFEDPGTVITTSLVEAGAMSAQEDGTIRLWNVSSDSNVSIVGS